MKGKILFRTVLFIIVFLIAFSALNVFFQPVWTKWNGYNATYGFYEEPPNTINTVVLGASVAGNGINTPELYSQYGICAYNLGTQRQPMSASYYWLQEVLRRHGKSLQTVIVEASTLRHIPEESFFHTAIDPMRNLGIKYRAYRDCFDYTVDEALMAMMPMYFYHTRWDAELSSEDFDKFGFTHDVGSRGYHFEPREYANVSELRGVFIDLNKLPSEQHASFNDESLYYFDLIYQLCQKNDLNLLLVKTPAWNWDHTISDNIQALADRYQIDYLDFCFSPLLDEIEYEHAHDSYDGKHLNYYGATKMTNAIGRYLVENYGAPDVRQDPRYRFMEDQYQAFAELTGMQLELRNEDEVSGYLATALKHDTTILITLKDEGACALTEEQRKAFADLGFHELSLLLYRNSYLAVAQNGTVLYEMRKAETQSGTVITHRDRLPDGKTFVLQSGSYWEGNLSSSRISGREESKNTTGLNIVVYSNRYGTVVDSVGFNTNLTSVGKVVTPPALEQMEAEAEALVE